MSALSKIEIATRYVIWRDIAIALLFLFNKSYEELASTNCRSSSYQRKETSRNLLPIAMLIDDTIVIIG